MSTPWRPPPTWLWPVLAAGIAGSGSACSAPAPPQEPVQDTATREPARDAEPSAPSTAPSPIDSPETPPPGHGGETPDEPPTSPPAAPPAARPPQPPADEGSAEPATVTVTMLSRGKGVPEEARAAYQEARELLERRRDAGAVDAMRAQRIGLEGETRLCAEFRSEREARAALAEIRQRVAGIDLLDATLAPCPSPKGKTP